MVTQRAFAKLRGVSVQTVAVWRRRGLIVFTRENGVDVAASEKLLDARPEVFRGGKVKPRPVTPVTPVTLVTPVEPLADPLDKLAPDLSPAVLAEAATWSLAEAARRKECALACLRQLEYDRERGAFVSIADVAKEVAGEYGIVKDRLLSLPGKLADGLVGLDRRSIEARLRTEVYECLSELHGEGKCSSPSP